VIKLWQRKWNQDVSDFYTRSLIPVVGIKVFFPQIRDIGISYCRTILRDTTLCAVLIHTILEQPLHLFVNVVLKEKQQNTFYCIVLYFMKLERS